MISAVMGTLRWVERTFSALIYDLAHAGKGAGGAVSDSPGEATEAQVDDVMDAMLDEDGIDATGL